MLQSAYPIYVNLLLSWHFQHTEPVFKVDETREENYAFLETLGEATIPQRDFLMQQIR
jgi:hypothetical protein